MIHVEVVVQLYLLKRHLRLDLVNHIGVIVVEGFYIVAKIKIFIELVG